MRLLIEFVLLCFSSSSFLIASPFSIISVLIIFLICEAFTELISPADLFANSS